jgi:hypothetical protein
MSCQDGCPRGQYISSKVLTIPSISRTLRVPAYVKSTGQNNDKVPTQRNEMQLINNIN